MNRRLFAQISVLAALFALAPAAMAATGPKTVRVDCAKGESINDALADKAPELVVEISGFCTEDVVVLRDKATLRGANPAFDGVAAAGADPAFGTALRVFGVSQVRLENLTVSGGAAYAFLAQNTTSVTAVNCRFQGAGSYGARLTRSTAVFEDCLFTGNGDGGLNAVDASRVVCERCTSRDNPSPGLGTAFDADRNSHGSVANSLLSGAETGSHQHSQVYIFDSTVEGSAFAGRQSTLDLSGVTLNGTFNAFFYSQINFTQSTQLPPGGGDFNTRSFLRVRNNSTITGDIALFAFSDGMLFNDSTLDGSLNCFNGGNALCQDPADVTGTSSCALCPKP